MQNFILLTLIVGLGFFLYLIKTGAIDSDDFNIKKVEGPVQFVITPSQTSSIEKSSNIQLDVKGAKYDIYTFTGSDFKHIARSDYFMPIYNIPLEATDAVTGTWLGSRYVFYVTEEKLNGSEFDLQYHVYKTEYSTDSVEPVEYIHYKTIKGLEVNNKLEVRY
ncbi:MAG: hypothetical protein V4576_01605 [Patescibacteria group bacterium]